MLGLLLLLAMAALGAGVARRLDVGLSRLEEVAVAGAVALTVGPWLVLAAAWTCGWARGLPLAIVAMAIGGAVAWRREPRRTVVTLGPSGWSWAALVALLVLLFRSHMLHAEPDGLYTGGSTYGDLALHATLARHFAITEVSFASPLVAGHPLTYPFLGDLLVASLLRGGWSIGLAFAVTGVASATLGLLLFEAVVLRMFRRRATATLTVWLVVLSGSAAGVGYAVHDLVRAGAPSSLAAMPNYANMRGLELRWANLVCDFLLPQRALLAALPGMWAAVLLLVRRERRSRLVAGVLLGALPMLHVHTFLLGVGLLSWLTAWHSVRARRLDRDGALAVVIALALAAPQLAWQFGASYGHGFGRWNLGWLAPSGKWWWFWLRNWGPALVLAPVALVVAARADREHALPLALAGVGVFAVINLYQFQPHAWDNSKFLVYAYLLLVPGLAHALIAWWSARGPRRVAAVMVIASLTASGALALVREAARHDRLASRADLARAAELDRVLPPDARVLTADTHNHVIPMLTGRAIVMGYRGWLWTHGIDTGRLTRDVRAMLRARPGFVGLLRVRGVTHVYLGPVERGAWGADVAAYRARFPRVFDDGEVEVFDVRGTPARLTIAEGRGLRSAGARPR